ncbi:UDP-hydrolyzing UDP-N-acetyl-D-glucosamine 2-epimerase [Salinibacter ruber]|uniref:UDP-N-acetylglucosamine 2-epimerase n=1 Tax=Salinibacter ruber TaxID=146919 RepID=UPI0021680145|nr:UDP-N-acetylglucosamine 2-epimerase [Salinibacter ruber]MCS4047525.1 UDP-hydrolyzing UDP-N-acetyl-D-glucosamine 2-epimerase [Salinibacter ruber]
MGSKKKVATVVTSRSQYARVKTALQALNESNRVNLSIILSGGALVHRFGDLSDIIRQAGLQVEKKIHTLLEAGDPVAQAKTTGMGLVEYATALRELDPDLMLTSGDRYETMACTLAASYLNVPVVHLEGGEITGSIDDKVRHATTKMADYHLVSTERSVWVVESLGESVDRIYYTGCPSIDVAERILQEGREQYDPQPEYGGVGDHVDVSSDYIVIQYHPIPTEYNSNYQKTMELISAHEKLDVPTFWFWPNMDAGTDQVSKAMREYREKNKPSNTHFFISLDPRDYLTLVKNSACMVGNSSVGIRECSYFGTPTVNIGDRQQSRERGPNVLDVMCDADAIAEGVRAQLSNGSYRQSQLYGTGDAAQKILDTIVDLEPELKSPMTRDLLE